jgi:hypothetical protein
VALTKIGFTLIKDNFKDAVSGSSTAQSSSFSTRVTTAETELENTILSGSAQIATNISGSLGANATVIRNLSAPIISGSLGANATVIRNLSAPIISGSLGANATVIRNLSAPIISGSVVSSSDSVSARVVSLEGSGTIQGVGTTDDVLFANITGSSVSASVGSFTTATIDKIGGAIDFNNENMTNVDIDSGVITGITDLTVADGGTGVSTLTDGGVLLGSGAGAITAMSVLADSEMIVGDGTTDPVAESGATLRTSIGVGTTDNVLFANITGSNDISASGNLSITGNVDVDGTSNFAGDVTMQNDLVVTGRLTAEEIHTTFISSSIAQATGSNIFGDATSDSHHFTGSVDISGSFTLRDGDMVVSDTLTATNIGAFTATGAIDFDSQNMTNVDIDSGTITGITDITVADGGTGASTFTDGGVLLGSGTSAITAMAVLTDGQMIVGDGTTDPVAESGATLRTSIGVGTTNDVKFANITGSNNISASGNISTTGTLRADGNVDFNADLDVDGTSNLDIVDIDGAVNMAADLTMGANILMADDTSIGIADDAERIEFDGAGDISVLGAQLLINQTASITIQGDNGLLQIASTDATAVQSLSKFSADANGFTLQFLKSRHATIGSNTIVQDDDTVGRIIFTAADGNDFGHASSEIRAQIDATPGTNEVPGRLVFLTTADGATGVTERMRIDSSGNVGIGCSPSHTFDVDATLPSSADRTIARFSAGSGVRDIALGWDDGLSMMGLFTPTNHSMFFGTNGINQKMVITSAGSVGIGTASPGYQLDLRRNDTGTVTSLGIRQLGSGDASMAFQTTTSPFGFCIGVDGSDSDAFKIATGTDDVGTTTRLKIEAGDGTVSIPGSLSVTGVVTVSTRIVSEVNASGGYAGIFANDGNNIDRYVQRWTGGTDDQSGVWPIVIINDGDGNAVGHIENSNGTFQLRDTSDSRLKDDIRNTSINGLNVVNGIKIRDFEWKNNKVTVNAGFIAQELKEVFPQAVSGELDEVYEDGKMIPLGVSKDRLVPVLVKAVQELSAKVEEQAKRIKELEN